MMFGVVLVGTYTSVFIAAPILIYLGVGDGPAGIDRRRKGHDRQYPLQRVSLLGRVGRSPSAAARRDRRLRQGRLPLRRHVASRLDPVPADGHLGMAGHRAGRDHRGVAGARVRLAASNCSCSGPASSRGSCRRRLRWRFRDARIGLEVTPTGAAVRTYNILFGEAPPGRRRADRGGLSAPLRYLAGDGRELSSLRGAGPRGRQGSLPRDACSRPPTSAGRCSRFMPSMPRSRACATARASRCRAKSACNGGAMCSMASGRARRPPTRSRRR